MLNSEFLVTLLKEFQIYAWSKKKYTHVTGVTLEKNLDKESDFYHNNRGIIGWKPLYEIARQPDLLSQKKVFLKGVSTHSQLRYASV